MLIFLQCSLTVLVCSSLILATQYILIARIDVKLKMGCHLFLGFLLVSQGHPTSKYPSYCHLRHTYLVLMFIVVLQVLISQVCGKVSFIVHSV